MTVLFDIDETLLINGKYPNNFNNIKRHIQNLKEYNYMFGICTNRPLDDSVKEVVANYSLNGPVITEGGACIYSNDFILDSWNNFDVSLNKLLKKYINEFAFNNRLNMEARLFDDVNFITVNKNRIKSSTIRFSKELEPYINLFIEWLKKHYELKKFNIVRDNYNLLKVNVYDKNINKIDTIEKYYEDESVIFITDFEIVHSDLHSNNLKVISVGTDKEFNNYCDYVFPSFEKGVEEILEKEERKMKNYEQISENCKMLWKEGFEIDKERYTQVSGYIFNEKNQLLIVKNETAWTIPGGHPEPLETKLETLNREIMEETSITIEDVRYLGAVEVVENGEIYYQLRYTAKVKEVLPFKKDFETSERLFVNLEDLSKYITWANGVTFSAQIESARQMWGI